MSAFSMEMPPAMSGDSQDAVQLRKYIARLVERLLYALNSIDDSNLTPGSIGLDKLKGGEAGIANATAATIGTAKMGRAEMQHLTAQVAEIVTAVVRTAVIDWAKLSHMVGDTAIVTRFVGENMFIDRLAVTSAQVVEMTVGTLCIKASNGKYYTLDVDLDDGTVTATETTVTMDEAEAGVTSGGKHIIESDLTVEELSASTVTAVEALISKIIAARIDVDQLFAREATIGALTTGSIAAALGERLNLSSNQSIISTVQRISGDDKAELSQSINQITQGLNATELKVQNLEDGIGTHVFIEPNWVRITQDQTKDWEQRLTATDLSFVNRTTGKAAASFGVSGGYADRLQSYQKLSVGTDTDGWYDMIAAKNGVNDKWRDGSATVKPVIVTEEPEDCVIGYESGTHSTGNWPETYGFYARSENAASYQWESRYNSTEAWTPISGATGWSLASQTLNAADFGKEFHCLMTDADGNEYTTRAARIRFMGAPVFAAHPPEDLEVVAGASFSLSVTAVNAASYQWQYRTSNSSWTDISGATSATLTTTGPSSTRIYHCRIADSSGRIAYSRECIVTPEV